MAICNTNLDTKVIILSNVKHKDVLHEKIECNDHVYELRFCASTFNERNGKFKSDVYSRHGNNFKKWWYMSRSDKFQLQSDVSPTLKQRKMYTIAYVKINYFDE